MEHGFWKWLWRFNGVAIATAASLVIGVLLWEITRDFRRDAFPTATTDVVVASGDTDEASQHLRTELSYGIAEETGREWLYVVPIFVAQTYRNRDISKDARGTLLDYAVVDKRDGSAKRLFGNGTRVILQTTPLVHRTLNKTQRIGTLLLIVEADTNGNGQLSGNDGATLYLVDPEWMQADVLATDLRDVHSVNVLDPTTFDFIAVGQNGLTLSSATTAPAQVIGQITLPRLD
ncbi:hypothetical protein [Nereida sp. MMG025]|uniref:hypothetical protein n=1 Tax=Nereida sp. MMG025 TaxID=2909981 RepID=UPI001F18941C|nr:hypothetical protein [Nereida sp. MMG025]MCF6444250.1 hypothetical protein [Nereida sp. MMG025]